MIASREIPSDPHASFRLRNRGLSLEQKVPLVITVLLVSLLSFTVAFAYREVRSSALRAEVERLDRLTLQLAESYRNTVLQRATLIEEIANDEALQRVLMGAVADSGELVLLLERLRSEGGSLTGVELRDREGRTILRLGAPIPSAPGDPDWNRADPFGALTGEEDRAELIVRSAIRSEDELLGHLVQARPFGNTVTAEQIADIIGTNARVYLGDGKGGWASLDGGFEPDRAWTMGPNQYLRGSQAYLAHMASVAGTPWQLAIERPLGAVLQRPSAFLRRISALLLVMIGLGAVLAWYLSRSFTHPLRVLTRAAESVARGDYGYRVDLERTDEFGTLAAGFNSMAGQVQKAHSDLQFQVEQARTLALELEGANQRLRELMIDAENARLLAEEANRAKSDFLATVSHEIRTPINAIVGYTDLMLLGIGGEPNPAQIENLERVRGNGRHLTRLIDDVLDLAKIEAGQLHVELHVGVAEEALENAVAMILPLARDRRIEVVRNWSPGEHTLYRGDPGRVEQILANLITNAVKFTPSGGMVTLSCECGAAGEGGECRTIHLHIDDTGVGIPEEKQEMIFERFVQAEGGYKRAHGGAGLGLAISRELARLMGGEITVQSRSAGGARFTLELVKVPGRG